MIQCSQRVKGIPFLLLLLLFYKNLRQTKEEQKGNILITLQPSLNFPSADILWTRLRAR